MSNPTELPDLADCPFCGSVDVDIMDREDGLYAVMCNECTAEGPAITDKDAARAGWNRRAQPEGEAPQAETLTPLDYRAQGREEALAIILGQSAEDPFSAFTDWGTSGAPQDEGSAYWKEDELRALLHIGDRKYDAYDRAEGAYWEALGEKDEAKREMLFVQQSPFYKPLHDFLAKHEAWDLMGELKRAQPATTLPPLCGAQHAESGMRLVGYLYGDSFTPAKDADSFMVGEGLALYELAAQSQGAQAPRIIGGQRWSKEAEMTEGWLAAQQAAAPGNSPEIPDGSLMNEGTSATGTPEAPADLPRLYRFDCYVGKTKMAAGVGVHASTMEEAEQKARKMIDKGETIKFESNRPCHATRKCHICAEYERAAQLDGGQEGSES